MRAPTTPILLSALAAAALAACASEPAAAPSTAVASRTVQGDDRVERTQAVEVTATVLAIDHASRPYGQSVWSGKPAGVLGISIGGGGTAMAQQHLRNVLTYLDMPTLQQPEVFLTASDGFFDAGGGIAAPDTKKFLQGWMDRYLAWVKAHTR